MFSLSMKRACLGFILFRLYSAAEFWHPTASPKVRLDLLSNQDILEGGKSHAEGDASGRLISCFRLSL